VRFSRNTSEWVEVAGKQHRAEPKHSELGSHAASPFLCTNRPGVAKPFGCKGSYLVRRIDQNDA
jgi:hypothetical protein